MVNFDVTEGTAAAGDRAAVQGAFGNGKNAGGGIAALLHVNAGMEIVMEKFGPESGAVNLSDGDGVVQRPTPTAGRADGFGNFGGVVIIRKISWFKVNFGIDIGAVFGDFKMEVSAGRTRR